MNTFLKTMGVGVSIVLIHYLLTHIYHQKCTMSFYNMFVPLSPLCQYTLDFMVLCNQFMTKMVYLAGGYLFYTMNDIFAFIHRFTPNLKKPSSQEM